MRFLTGEHTRKNNNLPIIIIKYIWQNWTRSKKFFMNVFILTTVKLCNNFHLEFYLKYLRNYFLPIANYHRQLFFNKFILNAACLFECMHIYERTESI